MTNITDDFERAGPGLGGSWTTASGFNDLEISSGDVQGTVVSTHCAAWWNANAFVDDQFAELTIVDLTSGFIGPTLRHQAGATNSFYVVYASSGGTLEFFKWTGGSAASLGASTAVALTGGDVLRIEASGSSTTSLTAKKNGATVHTASDSSSPFTEGSPGLNILYQSTPALARIEDWSAGPLESTIVTLGQIWMG